MSSSAKKFIRKILVRDPNTRLTPSEAMSNSFILKNLKKARRELKNCYSTKDLGSIKENIQLESTEDESAENYRKFYDEEKKFRLINTLHQDIGVRRV